MDYLKNNIYNIEMGVPGFYSWLTKRYPLIKHYVEKYELPTIDYLYLDMNGIIYKCVKDDSIIFKSQLLPKELEKIWVEIFNYINSIITLLKPQKMIVMGLDGVAPRSKMNNQRSRRFKSAKDHRSFMAKYYGFSGDSQSQENFKNNSISPGTQFMAELNEKLHFFIEKKIEEDDYWKSLSVIFTDSSVPGEGEHKIMQFIRANHTNFDPEDVHCLYGADADLIMLSMTLPLKNLCIIRQEFIPNPEDVKIIASRKKKQINFEIIYITILRQYFEVQYSPLAKDMRIPFDLESVMRDFVFLFFFIGNDFLPRCMAYNIREKSIEKLIDAFKAFLKITQCYVVGNHQLNISGLALLANHIAQYELKFIEDKSEDAQKYLQSSSKEFESQLSKLMKARVQKEQQFLLQLKTFYKNEDGSLRQHFYKNKFNIDPMVNTQDFYSLLNYYLYGLQFVFEYYFVNLPSWCWYYPYYYAPLVSDLSMYLNFLSSQGFCFDRIDPGQPYPPFKQLMCILPKASCADLLPVSFQEQIVGQNSLLRSPTDFYPEQFDEDLYGSVRSYQSIALIPFLNLDLVNTAYDKAIQDINEQQIRRNTLGKNILYEYDEKAEQIYIESPFPGIQSVNCSIQKRTVNLMEKFMWGKKNSYKKIDNTYKKMPTLKIKNFHSELKQTKNLQVFLKIVEENQQKIKLGDQVFYGYPLEHSGLVQGYITPEKFGCLSKFDPYDYWTRRMSEDFKSIDVIKSHPKQYFQQISREVNRQDFPQLQAFNSKIFYFVKDAMSFIRTIGGKFKRIYLGSSPTTFAVLPPELITKQKIYDKTKDEIIFKSLQQEFLKGEEVVVFPHNQIQQPLKGKVLGITQDSKVALRIKKKIKTLPNEVLKKIVNTDEIYFSLRFSAFIAKIRPDILLTLLDSISVMMMNQTELPPTIDIGLNFISRSEKKIVTNLVRINYENIERPDVQRDFKNLEISQRGIELIIEYKQKFPQIFKFIEQRHEKLVENSKLNNKPINWRQPICLNQIYEEEDIKSATKALMSVYFWIVKQEQTHMPLSSVFSKQISKRKIQRLQKEFQASAQKQRQRKNKKKYIESKEIIVDPNFIFSRRLANFGYFGLAEQPKIHTIRDEVIVLSPDFFGEYGIVIGCDENKFQILFEKPSFGKINLNGLCQDLWAGKFHERQLFNLTEWPKKIKPRHEAKKMREVEAFGWTEFNQTKHPKYKSKAINAFADLQLLRDKVHDRADLWNNDLYKYIMKIHAEQKVEKIDPEFQVVDTRDKRYEYKYDRGVTYIQKEFAEKLKSQSKYIQKPIQTSEVKNEEFKEEIIQNKIEENQQKQEQKLSDEEDGGDILQ